MVVADEAGGPVVVDLAESLDHRRQVVPAEIAHQPREFIIRALLDQLGDVALVSQFIQQALAPRSSPLEHQRGVKLVRTAVDQFAQTLAARLLERGLLQRAVLDDHHVPAEGLEQRLVARPQALADHRVEALAVVVDDPPAVPQTLLQPSSIASNMFPSSSSASPISAIIRPSGRCDGKCART